MTSLWAQADPATHANTSTPVTHNFFMVSPRSVCGCDDAASMMRTILSESARSVRATISVQRERRRAPGRVEHLVSGFPETSTPTLYNPDLVLRNDRIGKNTASKHTIESYR